MWAKFLIYRLLMFQNHVETLRVPLIENGLLAIDSNGPALPCEPCGHQVVDQEFEAHIDLCFYLIWVGRPEVLNDGQEIKVRVLTKHAQARQYHLVKKSEYLN